MTKGAAHLLKGLRRLFWRVVYAKQVKELRRLDVVRRQILRECSPYFTNAYDRYFEASGRKDHAGAVLAGINATPEAHTEGEAIRLKMLELVRRTRGRVWLY